MWADIRAKWIGIRYKYRKPLAEFAATAIMIAFGCGAVAQTVLSANNTWFSVSLAWGLGVTIAVHVAGGVSGAHLNPAVTFALALFRGFPWADLPIYWVAQISGAFVGALVVYVANCSALRAADREKTMGVFFTARQTAEVSTVDAFVYEFIATALLLIIILATTDKKNNPAGVIQPLTMGLSITLIGTAFGYQTGYAINPARDLGPRFFTAISGWGFGVFSRQDYYFWVPIVAPLLGATAGACVYDVFICSSDPKTDDTEHIC
ncbi:hypothetical protein KVV02_006929 [Mortierella alpina]|uniref:Aquaporin n=1 Tax=Mortierella alpina TaxID=64518 RepID=A0A9P8CW51_MORAP|nr:hypothetical protein KVV02_006929 [Mortierella alpina]